MPFLGRARLPRGLEERGRTGGRRSGYIRESNPVLGKDWFGGILGGNQRRRTIVHRFTFSPPSRTFTGPFFLYLLVVLSQLLRKGNGSETDFAQRTASLPVIPPIYTP